MKTAMQELIEHIESNEIVYNKALILKLKELLKKEKEQIIEAYSWGYSDGVQEPNPNDDYYNQTYNQNQ